MGVDAPKLLRGGQALLGPHHSLTSLSSPVCSTPPSTGVIDNHHHVKVNQ